MTHPAWLAGATGDWRLRLVVQPGASRTLVTGIHDGCLKVRVAAPPVDGRANEEIVRWMARRLGLTRAQVRIAAGASGRRKTVALEAALDAVAIVAALEPPDYQGEEPHVSS